MCRPRRRRTSWKAPTTRPGLSYASRRSRVRSRCRGLRLSWRGGRGGVASPGRRAGGSAWARPGGITRVEYSLDRGATWQPATIREPNIPRAWARWDFDWDARPGDHVIMTRAAADHGNRQPASIPWNAQGYGYNVPVPHPVKVS